MLRNRSAAPPAILSNAHRANLCQPPGYLSGASPTDRKISPIAIRSVTFPSLYLLRSVIHGWGAATGPGSAHMYTTRMRERTISSKRSTDRRDIRGYSLVKDIVVTSGPYRRSRCSPRPTVIGKRHTIVSFHVSPILFRFSDENYSSPRRNRHR